MINYLKDIWLCAVGFLEGLREFFFPVRDLIETVSWDLPFP